MPNIFSDLCFFYSKLILLEDLPKKTFFTMFTMFQFDVVELRERKSYQLSNRFRIHFVYLPYSYSVYVDILIYGRII